MKKISYLLVVLFAIAAISCKSKKDADANAELNMEDTKKENVQRPEGTMSKLDKLIMEVGIEGRTAERFKKIYMKYQGKRMEVKNSGGKPHQLMQMALKLRDDQNAEMEDILNDEQYERYLVAINDKAGRPQLKKEGQSMPIK